MDMERKDIVAEVKEIDEKGEGVLRFIRFHQEDKDSDITLPGFIQNQKAVLLASHNWKSDYPPLGSGESFEEDGATNFRFRLNLNDERAKSWYSWLKMDRDTGLQQVSYGFSPYADGQERGHKDGKNVRFLKPRPDGSPGAKLHEISFVTVGSGNDTAVIGVKERMPVVEESREQPAIEVPRERHAPTPTPTPKETWHVVGVHHTGIDDSPFEAVRHYKRLQTSQAAGLYRSAFALQWPGTQAEMKESWGLLHHIIDDDGKPGAASLHACLVGMSLLKGWDGLFVPEDIREQLHAHYAAHLLDGGYDVPELMKRDSGMEIKHELKFWLWQARSVLDRRERVKEFLIRVGKAESQDMVEQFDQLYRYVTHMHRVGGSAGEAMSHMEEQEELTRKAEQISQEVLEDARQEEEAKQAELRELFERFRVNHG